MRRLLVILGDQLDASARLLQISDPAQDVVWMAEVEQEATYVPSHAWRLIFFFAAMRHFRDQLCEAGWEMRYHELTSDREQDIGRNFADLLARQLDAEIPEQVCVTQPGDYRVLQALQQVTESRGLTLEVVADDHFYCSLETFRDWAAGRKLLVLEHFYRFLRKETGTLMQGKQPEGGEWNYDSDNRERLPEDRAAQIPEVWQPQPDELTRQVMHMVAARFPDAYGDPHSFAMPVTAEAAQEALREFIQQRLSCFGTYQDAIAVGQPFLYHARLSALMNVKLLNPRDCVEAAVQAYQEGRAPLNAVEGFVRQILGWREYVRGLYWLEMPGYADLNALEARAQLPAFFWTGDTDMACLRDALSSVLQFGYAHHIQRLMVIGLFSLLYGVHPYRFHEWHMGMYLDAIDWVSLPNVLGMSQFGDGGLMATKPYCASGNYINKMSNACSRCRYRPHDATGDAACPYTTLYYDFLDRHQERFSGNLRMQFQLKNLERKGKDMPEIRQRAAVLRQRWATVE